MPRAISIAKIEGLSDAHVAKLTDKGIKTLDDLWTRVGQNFDTGIKQVSDDTQVPEDVVTALLIADGLGKVRIKNAALYRVVNVKVIAALLVVAVVASAVYLFVFRSDLPQQVVVTNPQGIAAYRVIGEKDVEMRRVPFRRGQTLSDLQTAIGGYALTNLEHGAPIRSSQILPANVSRGMKGNYLVSVPVKASSLGLAPKPGSKLALLPVPDQKDKTQPPPTSTIEALLLSVEQREGGPTLVVVVDSIDKMNALVGGATIVSVVP
ncbi:MAG TPA: SAF domain-containing protein [Pyrinomonadaceae bacterium]|nr:SAF domain-containing protein [Pyrinomonadaceae bacterium]